jgi:hypothetical protein
MPPPRDERGWGLLFFLHPDHLHRHFATLRLTAPAWSVWRLIDAPPRDDYRFCLWAGSVHPFSRSSRLSELN